MRKLSFPRPVFVAGHTFTSRRTVVLRTIAFSVIVFSLLQVPNLGVKPASASSIGCSAGSLAAAISAGSGVIELPPGCTISLTSALGPTYVGFTGLPAVTGTVTIYGGGGVITRSSSIPFRLFYIAPGAQLNLIDLTLDHGWARGINGETSDFGSHPVESHPSTVRHGGDGDGGAVFINSNGTLNTANVTYSNDQATGGNGGNGGGNGVNGGPGGPGGPGFGGVFYNEGRVCSTGATFSGNSVSGGKGGTPGGADGYAVGPRIFGNPLLVCTATTITAAPVSAAASSKSVTLSASVSSAGSAGSVNFSVYDGTGNQVGSSVSGPLAGGTAKATFSLPAKTPAGAYKIHAIYVPAAGGTLTGSEGTGTLTLR